MWHFLFPKAGSPGSKTPRCQLSASLPLTERAGGSVRLPLLHRASDRGCEVGLFPGEAAVFLGRAAKMTVGRSPLVDRPVELERAANIGRGKAEQLRQNFL